jgi:hypothetical protein
MATHLAQQPLLRRIGWLVLIWAMSILALGRCRGLFQSGDESRGADRVKFKITSHVFTR